MSPEVFERGHHVNSISYTMLANSLINTSNFDIEENLEKAYILANAAFHDNYVSGLFIQLVHNKSNKLIDSDQMLKREWNKVKVY